MTSANETEIYRDELKKKEGNVLKYLQDNNQEDFANAFGRLLTKLNETNYEVYQFLLTRIRINEKVDRICEEMVSVLDNHHLKKNLKPLLDAFYDIENEYGSYFIKDESKQLYGLGITDEDSPTIAEVKENIATLNKWGDENKYGEIFSSGFSQANGISGVQFIQMLWAIEGDDRFNNIRQFKPDALKKRLKFVSDILKAVRLLNSLDNSEYSDEFRLKLLKGKLVTAEDIQSNLKEFDKLDNDDDKKKFVAADIINTPIDFQKKLNEIRPIQEVIEEKVNPDQRTIVTESFGKIKDKILLTQVDSSLRNSSEDNIATTANNITILSEIKPDVQTKIGALKPPVDLNSEGNTFILTKIKNSTDVRRIIGKLIRISQSNLKLKENANIVILNLYLLIQTSFVVQGYKDQQKSSSDPELSKPLYLAAVSGMTFATVIIVLYLIGLIPNAMENHKNVLVRINWYVRWLSYVWVEVVSIMSLVDTVPKGGETQHKTVKALGAGGLFVPLVSYYAQKL